MMTDAERQLLLERLAAAVACFTPNTPLRFALDDSDPEARQTELHVDLHDMLDGFMKGLDEAEPNEERRAIIRDAIATFGSWRRYP